jgi:hypothetical protein
MADITLSAITGITPTVQLYLEETAVGTPITMTQIGTTGEYYCNMPADSYAGTYLVVFNNGSEKLTSGVLFWDGEKEITVGSIPETVVTDLGGNGYDSSKDSLIKINGAVKKNLTKTQYLGLS